MPDFSYKPHLFQKHWLSHCWCFLCPACPRCDWHKHPQHSRHPHVQPLPPLGSLRMSQHDPPTQPKGHPRISELLLHGSIFLRRLNVLLMFFLFFFCLHKRRRNAKNNSLVTRVHQSLSCSLMVLYESVSGHSCVIWSMTFACIYTFSFARHQVHKKLHIPHVL